MPYAIDDTHNPNLESWIESANDPDTDFPIQNLPLCVCDADELGLLLPLCMRLGDTLIDLDYLSKVGLLDDWEGHGRSVWDWVDEDTVVINRRGELAKLRQTVSSLFAKDNPILRDNAAVRGRALIDVSDVDLNANAEELEGLRLLRPFSASEYTDFYASVYHATNVGSMFRPENPLLPNYKWIPVGYHGRSSTIVLSGESIYRPVGQQAPAEEGGAPGFGPCKMLDYELEMGVIMRRENGRGETISIEEAEDHILGLCLLNDWSARDMQKWEYVPLGPFLAKSFATTVSPYIVTMEALAPFRAPAMPRPEGDPKPLPHLFSERDQAQGGLDITLEVHLASKQMRERGMNPIRLSKGSFKDMYWTVAQMVTHHASNGCNLRPGDLLGSGTVSGPTRDARGCLLELTWDGDPFADPAVKAPGTQRTPIELPTGETRKFLADGDEVILKGYCEREGFRRIGFGECRGIIEPASD